MLANKRNWMMKKILLMNAILHNFFVCDFFMLNSFYDLILLHYVLCVGTTVCVQVALNSSLVSHINVKKFNFNVNVSVKWFFEINFY